MKIDKSDLIYNVDLEFDKENEIKEKTQEVLELFLNGLICVLSRPYYVRFIADF